MFPRLQEDTAVKVSLGLLITIVSFLAVGGFTVGRTLTRLDDRIVVVEKSYEEHDELRHMIEENKATNQEINLRLVRIETDTNWIRLALQEMAE